MLSVCPSVRLIQGSSSQVLKGSYLFCIKLIFSKSRKVNWILEIQNYRDKRVNRAKSNSNHTFPIGWHTCCLICLGGGMAVMILIAGSYQVNLINLSYPFRIMTLHCYILWRTKVVEMSKVPTFPSCQKAERFEKSKGFQMFQKPYIRHFSSNFMNIIK